MEKLLKIYMGYSHGAGSAEGAGLIFAHNSREAKKLAYGILTSWYGIEMDSWIDTRTNLIRNSDFLYKEADQEKLANGIAHVIESPKICNRCEHWGYELDESGICTDCRENEEEESAE